MLRALTAIVYPSNMATSSLLGEVSRPTCDLETELSDLRRRIQALPQELQDSILEALLQYEKVVYINRDFKTPLALRLCHKTRSQYAPAYFAESQFVVCRDGSSWKWFRKVTELICAPTTTWKYACCQSISTTHSWPGFDVWVFKCKHEEFECALSWFRRERSMCGQDLSSTPSHQISAELSVNRAVGNLIGEYLHSNPMQLGHDRDIPQIISCCQQGGRYCEMSFSHLTLRAGNITLATRIVKHMGLHESMPVDIGAWDAQAIYERSYQDRIKHIVTQMKWHTLRCRWFSATYSDDGRMYEKPRRYVAHAMELHGKTEQERHKLMLNVDKWLREETEEVRKNVMLEKSGSYTNPLDPAPVPLR